MNAVNAWVNWAAWVGVIGWIYWLSGRVQQLLNYAEQLLAVSQQLLAQVPGKSAPRTDGADTTPAEDRRFLGVRMVPDQRPTPGPRTEPITTVVDVGLEQILDAPQPAPARGRHRG